MALIDCYRLSNTILGLSLVITYLSNIQNSELDTHRITQSLLKMRELIGGFVL